MNNGFYSGQFSPDNSFPGLDQGGGGGADGLMGMLGQDGMPQTRMVGGQSLDDIVNTNSKAHQRRKSMAPHKSADCKAPDLPRRMSLIEFGDGGSPSPLDGFAFDPRTGMEGFAAPSAGFPTNNANNSSSSSGPLGLNRHMANSAFHGMAQPGSAYASPMQAGVMGDADLASPYMNHPMSMAMDLVDPSLGMSGQDPTNLPFFNPSQHQQFHTSATSSPMHANFSNTPQHMSATTSDARPGMPQARQSYRGGHTNGTSDSLGPRSQSGAQSSHSSSMHQSQARTSQGQRTPQKNVTFGPPRSQQMQVSGDSDNHIKVPWSAPPGGFPSSRNNRPHVQTQYKDAYSSSGFDMLNVLMRVATRPNPEINIGAVDLSCAFVVTDAEKDDNPIVYCSENFERLTGYTKHMILGRNCRFLQSPDGNVESGVKRKYVDDDSVLYLKNMVISQQEAQISLINYRRGGQPFMNLLTIIPVRMDGPDIKFFVGFQVDLVEQPNSITSQNADGSFTINYQRGLSMPRYVMHTPENNSHMDLGQTITRDDVSTVLTTIGTGDSELSKRIWDKVLLENTDDVVHVLSLKGLFLYLSPSCRKVLEYEAGELVGTALSSVCHPSDIVPVTRELKDTSSGTTVNVVFRIRRKNSGYMWFESHGSLHTEQGKGRKCIILVGRERPVYTLSKSEIAAAGGIGENELWTKLSTSGMFLFVSSNVRQLLDRQPEELVGTSIQQLMRPESRQEIGRMLSLVRTGKGATAQHEVMNRRGQVLKALTTMYPGDATEGHKPTFVVAQTRLIRFHRSSGRSASDRLVSVAKQEPNGFATPSAPSIPGDDGTPMTSFSASKYPTTDGAPITFAGQNGLLIGRQDASLASEENLFDELKTTRSSSWQYELRQMERRNRLLAEEVQQLLAAKKKRKRRKGAGQLQKDCANCHTRTTPEWRRGPSGNRDLCNSCGLRWAKQNGRISPRASSQHSVHSTHSDKASKTSASPLHNSMTVDQVGGKSATPSTQRPDKRQMSIAVSPARYNSNATKEEPPQLSPSGVPPKIDEGIEPD